MTQPGSSSSRGRSINEAARRTRRRYRALALMFAAATLITLLLSTSLALDVGYTSALRAEAQNTADAAALAGAVMLQEGHADRVMERSYESMALTRLKQGVLAVDDRVVEIGKWDSRYHKFHPLPSEEWERDAFAVRVRAVRNKAPRLLAVVGGAQGDVWRESVAVGSRPCHGIWGLEGVLVQGTLQTDSYLSEEGSYSDETARADGDLCSGRGITVNGSVDIRGDAMSGYGYPITLQGRAMIAGLTTDRVGAVPSPSVATEGSEVSNDNQRLPRTDQGGLALRAGNMLVLGPNESLDVPPGRYLFASVALDPTSTIRFSGPTTLLVNGRVDAVGAKLVNSTKDPRNLVIVCSGGSLKIGGEAETYASIAAPKADVRIHGPGDMYGALLGRYVTVVGKVAFHVDEALPNPVTPPEPFWVK